MFLALEQVSSITLYAECKHSVVLAMEILEDNSSVLGYAYMTLVPYSLYVFCYSTGLCLVHIVECLCVVLLLLLLLLLLLVLQFDSNPRFSLSK
jgi:hypothetical protein